MEHWITATIIILATLTAGITAELDFITILIILTSILTLLFLAYLYEKQSMAHKFFDSLGKTVKWHHIHSSLGLGESVYEIRTEHFKKLGINYHDQTYEFIIPTRLKISLSEVDEIVKPMKQVIDEKITHSTNQEKIIISMEKESVQKNPHKTYAVLKKIKEKIEKRNLIITSFS